MAVHVRLSARGVPRRMAAACFPIASTPVRAFGGWDHRVTASYGTVPQPASGPPTTRDVPPDTSGSLRTTSLSSRTFAPTWSIVRPSLPRVLPWAGTIPHGVPNVTYTPAIGQAGSGQTPITGPTRMMRNRPRTPIAQARVTTAPRPFFFWRKQGGGDQLA